MPGELKNLVSLAISSSSGSSKYSSSHHQQKHEKKDAKGSSHPSERARRSGSDNKKHNVTNNPLMSASSKEEGGAKRFTKLLSKSVGAVSSSFTHSSHARASSSHAPPPTAVQEKKAPVASPESEGSSLLNGGNNDDQMDLDEFSESYLPTSNVREENDADTPNVHLNVHIKNTKPWSMMNGSAHGPCQMSEECSADEGSDENWRSIVLSRHRYSTDASRGAETDDETQHSLPLTGVTVTNESANKSIDKSSDANEPTRGWYATRKSYRSVAYKTWTVGAARKLLNSSRSDYDLPPSKQSVDSSRTVIVRNGKSIGDGSVSDGEEKFYNCTYSRSQDDDLDRSIYLSAISGIQNLDHASKNPDPSSGLTNSDIHKMRARKCASSDAVTFFTHTAHHPISHAFLSPVDSVPSTSSEKSPNPYGENAQEILNGSAKHADSGIESAPSPSISKVIKDKSAQITQNSETTDRLPIHEIPDSISPGSGKTGGKSWLLIASSSSDDVWKEENAEFKRPLHQEEANKNKWKYKAGSKSTGDCFSSEDYLKFTLKKHLLQQRQKNDFPIHENGGNEWANIEERNAVKPPLLALDRDIRMALNNFNDLNRCQSPPTTVPMTTRHQRSSSPTTLANFMNAAQQRWKQQSERFSRKMERSSCRAKLENHTSVQGNGQQKTNSDFYPNPTIFTSETKTPIPNATPWIRIPPPQLSSSSFSSTSSSSSSMSWISQNTKPKNAQKSILSPLAISVDANGGDHGDEWAPNDPSNAGNIQRLYGLSLMRTRSKTTTALAAACSPFRSSDEAMQFLKLELANIRKKDHQILTQLKMLDAEISRRKSETDALAPIRSSSESADELDADYSMPEPTGGRLVPDKNSPKLDLGETTQRLRDFKLTHGGNSNVQFTHPYSNSIHANDVPPMPKCLEVNFKTL